MPARTKRTKTTTKRKATTRVKKGSLKAKSKKTVRAVKAKAKSKPASKARAKVKGKIKSTLVKKKVSTKPVKKVVKSKPVKAKATSKAKATITKVTAVKAQAVEKKTTVTPKRPVEKRVKILQPVKFFEFEGIEPYMPKRTEDYMSPGMRDHFRKILIAWRDRLVAEADRTVNLMRDGADVPADMNDRATQEEEFSLELRARDRDRKLIRKIESSLRAIDSGDYGYCDACGEEVGLRRLEARPTAKLCIDCKTLDEIKEKQTGS